MSDDYKDEEKALANSPTPLGFRYRMIKMGLETEMRGCRLTAKAPPCFTIIKREFGIKAKRGPAGKYAAYVAFCERFGFTAKPDPKAPPPAPTPSLNALANGCSDADFAALAERAQLLVEVPETEAFIDDWWCRNCGHGPFTEVLS